MDLKQKATKEIKGVENRAPA